LLILLGVFNAKGAELFRGFQPESSTAKVDCSSVWKEFNTANEKRKDSIRVILQRDKEGIAILELYETFAWPNDNRTIEMLMEKGSLASYVQGQKEFTATSFESLTKVGSSLGLLATENLKSLSETPFSRLFKNAFDRYAKCLGLPLMGLPILDIVSGWHKLFQTLLGGRV